MGDDYEGDAGDAGKETKEKADTRRLFSPRRKLVGYLDGGIGWLVHGGHSWAVKLAGEALDVALQRHRAHTWLEVEQALCNNHCDQVGVMHATCNEIHKP